MSSAKARVVYSFAGQEVRSLKKLDEVIRQQTLESGQREQQFLSDNLRCLMKQLESGMVHFVTVKTLPRPDKPKADITLLEVMLVVEKQVQVWEICRGERSQAEWEVKYTFLRGQQPDFKIYSCDVATPVRIL